MSETIIVVENLSKLYRIRHQLKPNEGLRHVLQEKLTSPFRALFGRNGSGRDLARGQADEDFWALKNVCFEVKRGEVIGIIGRNGAGKSTLLKVLSRITDPTEGRVRLRGRVASLLEVGTGFHPELTGRENIFLNGSILGMSKAEIRRKFDEIVAFSEVEKFLDTPVKRYSSGMYVRLAFAVAAHLEPEILIVDEVLAVGDTEFQKKCLGKMQTVSKGGRTVLFVSHNMAAVESLCTRAIYLAKGQVRAIGNVSEQIELFSRDSNPKGGQTEWKPVAAGKTLVIQNFAVSPTSVTSGSPLEIDIGLKSPNAAHVSDLAILIYSSRGVRVAVLDLRGAGGPIAVSSAFSKRIRCTIPSLPFIEGEYQFGIYIKTDDFNDNLLELAAVTVKGGAPVNGVTRYPAAHRGLIELEFTVGE